MSITLPENHTIERGSEAQIRRLQHRIAQAESTAQEFARVANGSQPEKPQLVPLTTCGGARSEATRLCAQLHYWSIMGRL